MASITSVTEDDLAAARCKATEACKELNKLFEDTPARNLLRTGKIAFIYHPGVARGDLGEAYKEGSKHWAENGALEQLVDMLEGHAGQRPQFEAGFMGSYWFDTELTGGIGDKKRTKLVRVTPIPDGRGGWHIMLDNTFGEAW